jgi:glycine/serine hydroxymethyltransferase
MEKFGAEYAKNIISKAQYFAKLLSKELHTVGPLPYFTNTHQICIEVPNIIDATQKLASLGIITMPERTPFTHKKGLRLGIQEQCRLGVTRKDLLLLSKIIISCVNNKKINKNTKNKLRALARKLNSVHYTID